MSVCRVRSVLSLAACAATLALGGCFVPIRPPNPSFPASRDEAQRDLDRMAADPVKLARPLIVLAGIGDLSISSGAIVRRLRPCLEGEIVGIHFFDETTFAGSRQKLLREVARELRTDPDHLPEVDVVAFSMGGLVARDAAIADEAGRRLPIRRLLTISTPHEGARLAGAPLGYPQGADMRPTSEFLDRLRQSRRDYELVCYARLDDVTVGEEFAAPTGEPIWWVPTPPGEWSHMAAFNDPRIIADIARRLRGERSLSRPPASPLPQ